MSIDTAIQLRIIGYVLFLVVPFVFLYLKGFSRKPFHVLVKVVLSVVAMYLAIVVPLGNLNHQLDSIVRSLDRDGDGLISQAEMATWTEQEKRANEMWVGDGARNVFGYLVAPIFATAYTATIFGVFYFGYWLVRKFRNRADA